MLVNAVETGTMHKAVTAKTRAAVKRCEAFCMTVDIDDRWDKAWVGAPLYAQKSDAPRKSGGAALRKADKYTLRGRPISFRLWNIRPFVPLRCRRSAVSCRMRWAS